MHLEERADHRFHPDSYGYRPNKSAHQALGACRQRCWKYDWVIDLDVQKFFDTVPWDLVVKAVRAVTDCRWVLLYVKRWLAAPLQHPDGVLEQRSKGTPQGSAVSPILANLFMHYAFDLWMVREFPDVRFERYCDDAVVHCVSEGQAHQVWDALADRLAQVGLELHPDKTRVVYCKDGKRRGSYEHTAFTFLGFTFRARGVRTKSGRMFTSFIPAISKDALAKLGAQLRSWRLHRLTVASEADLAERINPIVRGWMNYYGAFYRSALYPVLTRINAYLMRWLRNKFKRLRGRKKAHEAWTRAVTTRPRFFAQWAWVTSVPAVW
jgi:group II intron reverse transcriptase/maturase